MKTGYTVHDCMTTKPVSADASETLQAVSKKMLENHVGALLVTEGEKPVGIVTEQDIVRKFVAQGVDPCGKTINDFRATQQKELITISPGADIYEALVKMRDYNIRHLPVVDDSKVIGLLTIKDVLKIEPQLFDLLVEKFELQEWERKQGLLQREMDDNSDFSS